MRESDRNLRFDALRLVGCMACRANLRAGGFATGLRCEIHHQNEDEKAGNPRLGDEFTVGLCSWHHRGDPMAKASKAAMLERFGPPLTSARAFRLCYGRDAEMLKAANDAIRILLPEQHQRAAA